MEGENKDLGNSKKQDHRMLEGASSERELLSSLKESMKQKEEEMSDLYNEFCAKLEELGKSAGTEEALERELVDFEAKVSAFYKDKEQYKVKLYSLFDASMERFKEAVSILQCQMSSSPDKVGANPEAFFGNKEDKAIMQWNDPEILKKHKQEFDLVISRNEEGPASKDSLKKLKDSMKQEEEQMRVYHNDFCAKVEELRRTGGSQEALQKEIVNFEEKLSIFQKANEKYSLKLIHLIDDSLGKLKDGESILVGEKSSSDKRPEALFLGKMKDEALQADDHENLKKYHKREFHLVSTGNEGPLNDFSKKVEAESDCSDSPDKKQVQMDIKALHQEKYKSVVGVNSNEESSVGESTQKEMNQSEDKSENLERTE